MTVDQATHMQSAEWIVLGCSLVFIAGLGAWHLGGILLIKKVKPSSGNHPHLAVLVAFWGLILLHFSEIVLGALAFGLVLNIEGTGDITEGYGSTMGGLLYFSGVTFTTLGFTQQTATGAVRLLVMTIALGGFMLITWSATFVYSIWDERFRNQEEREKEEEEEDEEG